MAIEKMKKLRILAVRSDREELLKGLMLLGCVEISEPSAFPEEPEISAVLKRESGDLAKFRNDYAKLQSGLKVLDKYSPVKSKLLSPRPEVTRGVFLDESMLAGNLETAAKLDRLDSGVRGVTAEEGRVRMMIGSLKPWENLDLDLDPAKNGTVLCDAVMGTMPHDDNYAAAETALSEKVPESCLTEVSSDRDQRYVLLICLKDDAAAATETLRPFSFSPVSPGKLQGTPKQNIELCEKKLEELAAEKADIVGQITEQASERDEMKLCSDRLFAKVEKAEAAERLLCTESSLLLSGWIPAREEKQLSELLSGYDCAWETEEPDPEKQAQTPVKLRNNRLTAPYNMVTNMYSLPAYNGLDPNPFVMPAFALFFGIMFADMAYGILMFAVGLTILRKARPRGGMKNMAWLAVQCGITTFIIGFLTGGFFGDAVSVVGGIFGKEWSIVPPLGVIRLGDAATINLPLNLLEGNNPLYMLVFAMCIGVVHLAIGVGISTYLKFRDGEWLDAVLNDLSWWVMFIGLALYVLGNGLVLLIIGAAMMVVGAVLKGKGFGRVTSIFSSVYSGVTGYLGDILSYSRLMALMLAGSVIASVFNQLGSLGGILMFIPVFLIGHSLNFALNLIGCFVHTMRLQFLEFFGKWYRDGGRPFRPLTINTKYVDIIKEDL
ncbi:MAG: V-type ATP synthase subunit I [Oscillospiraceae bacterium]|nr:V-type ATP synthase subunit I [Oscillospiraceae bacterium]